MKRPMIGVLPLVDIERDSYWMLPGYFKCLENAGALPVMLPLTDDPDILTQITNTFDGFLFTGGHDVAPAIYGEEAIPGMIADCSERDAMEIPLLKMIMDADKPILGICRGLQFINAALGGTLYQDLPTQHPSGISHKQDPPYTVPAHKNRLIKGTMLANLIGSKTIEVNTCHHQAIRVLAPGLQAMAVSEDELIEAFIRPESKYLVAVQWHPEFDHEVNSVSRTIIHSFIDACV